MADKKVEIRIDTQANTKGAKQAEDALENVTQEAREVGKAVGDINQARSIDAMERELVDLTKQLRAVSVGSQEFGALAERIQEVERELEQAHQAASGFTRRINDVNSASSKLGKTVGKGGNAGGAVLEFSRAFEDAQYGIRGVLNNLPGLIAMLGGGAGLAGVISIAAVAGTYLWEKMQQGPKDSTKSAEEYLDLLKQIAKRMGEEDRDVLDLRKQADDERTESLRNHQALQERIFNAEITREKSRIQADGNLEIAKERLKLAMIERQLATTTGEEALRLAKEREDSLTRILDKERQIAEQVRQQDVKAAEERIGQTKETVDTSEDQVRKWFDIVGKETRRRDELQDIIAEESRNREQLIKEVQESIEKIRQENGRSPLNQKKAGELSKLEQQERDLQKPTARESEASEKLSQQLETLKEAQEKSKESAKQLQEAERKLRVATEDLAQLRNNQAQERLNDKSQNDFAADSNLEIGKQQAADDVSQKVSDLIESIKAAIPNPNDSGVKYLIDQLAALQEGGVQQEEQQAAAAALQKLVGLTNSDYQAKQQFYGSVSGVFEEQNKLISRLVELCGRQKSQLDEQGNRIKTLEQNQGHPNH